MTLTEIAKAVGISRPTVEDVVEALLGQGWLDELQPTAAGTRSAGRPARRFTLRGGRAPVRGCPAPPGAWRRGVRPGPCRAR
ncbi:hypothetical protein [Streptomyces sioyaensis]|uniref:hypothetical protein n=1 Tax=Streptomyces sioyaensis TaxID=67364 RepID=UPI003D72C1A6